jgi:GMP synthase (glutamine-hydrolysing)
MKILCIKHADFESPGIIQTWALTNNHHFKIERPYRGEVLSSVQDFDFLLIMGGPQSAVKVESYPYLAAEIELIKAAVAQQKKILGVCLGAQLIGVALGAAAARSPEKEVGVYPITFTAAGKQDGLLHGLSNPLPVIHWHNDMPGIPDGAVVLAESLGCPRQIVRFAPTVYGFQCHLEITLDGIKTMVDAVPHDLHTSKFTQTKQELLQHDYVAINEVMLLILDRFMGLG